MPQNLVLVCAGADAARAQETGRPLLHLCLGLRPNGRLDRLTLPARQPGCYLGVSDLGLSQTAPGTVCEQLIAECMHAQAAGLFADFERDTPPVRAFLSRLDQACHEQGLAFFLPATRAEDTTHAWLLAETAVSGGSLRDYFGELRASYGARVAAALKPVSQDFCLPSPDSAGQVLSAAEREALLARTGAQTFFSRELCARYFTYMDADGNGHFVLFDDETTIRAKLDLLDSIGIPYVFALYPDVRALL